MFEGTERFFKPNYVANLTTSWIPALEGVEDRLKNGGTAKVADVGCGHGVSTILMAKAYPNSQIIGFDYHRPSIEWARKQAEKEGLKNITFEEGAKREFIETIRDASEIQKVGYDFIRSAKEEILIFFSAASALHREAREGGILQDLLEEETTVREVLPRGMKIRILVPMDSKIRNEMVEKIKRLGIEIRDNKKALHAKFTNLVVDNKFSLTIELKDGTKKPRDEESTRLATYSNSDSIIFSYVSMFESLWIQNENNR